jgi:hypothetical protein
METGMPKGRNDPLSRTVIGNFVTQEDSKFNRLLTLQSEISIHLDHEKELPT